MTGFLDRWEPDVLQRAIQVGDPDEVALLIEALREELEDRLLHWRCTLDPCDGMPHDGFQYRHARAEQRPPDGDWSWWLLKAGRGGGKTRTGAETAKDGLPQSLLNLPRSRWALVGRTFADVRDVMVEGESGLLSVLPASALRGGSVTTAWNRSIGELHLANGSLARAYSSERPAALRGPQFHGAWGDEPAHWLDAHKGELEDSTWSNLNLTLRLGDDPRGILTTTPARVKMLTGTREHPGILYQPDVHVSSWSTFSNIANLARTFRDRIIGRYAGTRLGRQELDAELLDDVEGALWTLAGIDAHRVDHVDPGQLDVIVVAVDPNVTDADQADECGVVVVGSARVCPICGPDKRGAHAFVLQDATTPYGPTVWPGWIVGVYDQNGADRVVAEANQGHDLVVNALRAVDPALPVTKVVASRGKRTRAEPVATLYEVGRVHHVGSLPELEEQMTGWIPGEDSPDRMDALVWGVTDALLGKPQRRMRHRD